MSLRPRGWRFLLGLIAVLPGLALADGLSEIQKRGTVRVGVAEFPPWTFKNAKGGLEGFEIDVGRRLAQDMGVHVEYKVYPLDELLDAVDKGEIDLIAAGLAITPSRALRIEFSSHYMRSGVTLVVNSKLAAEVGEIEDLNKSGLKVVAVSDTMAAELGSMYFDEAELKIVADDPAADKEMLRETAIAYLTSVPEAEVFIERYGDRFRMPLDRPPVGSVAGFGVRRGNQALLNFLNAWIEARSADRWLQSTYDYWFSGQHWPIEPGE